MTKKALYPGSFDPPTRGHLWVIEQGALLFEELYVADGINPQKVDQYMFSAEERREMLQQITSHLPNVQVVSMGIRLQYEFAQSLGIKWLLRGERSAADFREHLGALNFHERQAPWLNTVKVTPPVRVRDISSSFAKSFIGYQDWWYELKNEDCLPPEIYRRVLKHYLAGKWKELMQNLGVKKLEEAEKVFSLLMEHYSEEHRKHHGPEHILQGLQEISCCLQEHGVGGDADRLAEWFHDAIYEINPEAKNEAASAKLLVTLMRPLGVHDQVLQEAETRIIASQHDRTQSLDPEVARFVDIDLTILGQRPEIYWVYEEAIRQEYSRYSDEEYCQGRLSFLNGLLAFQPIFHTDVFKARYEKQALENIQAACTRLKEKLQSLS